MDYVNSDAASAPFKEYIRSHSVVRRTAPGWEHFGPLHYLTKKLRFERFGGSRERLGQAIEAHRELVRRIEDHNRNTGIGHAETRRQATRRSLEGEEDRYGLQRVLFGAFYGYDLTEFLRCWACRGLFSFYPYLPVRKRHRPILGRYGARKLQKKHKAHLPPATGVEGVSGNMCRGTGGGSLRRDR